MQRAREIGRKPLESLNSCGEPEVLYIATLKGSKCVCNDVSWYSERNMGDGIHTFKMSNKKKKREMFSFGFRY